MLVVREDNTLGNKRVQIGETVKVLTSGQTGSVVGYANGQWEVKLPDGNTVRANESQLEVRQVLFG